jgi:hypothetical protein
MIIRLGRHHDIPRNERIDRLDDIDEVADPRPSAQRADIDAQSLQDRSVADPDRP